ncbi:UNVERIFIED_ORG: hemin uptake protein HemP [Zoogloea ramigera]|uniref:Hemin uptake protein HemP n=2 Tax=Telluria group TaxID=2895353 RepID=A0ABZ0Y1F1_9BURK|nr:MULTISPECIES: hemin uptake protein HemP [Duganella]KQN75960.1 hemin transporter HemP [Duganella sp. Leaf61]WQH05845.1 hemin uptake protein HemP [Duganella zoogloeoides]
MPTALPMTQPVMNVRPAPAVVSVVSAVSPIKRISSAGLMDGGRELEIEHAGRVYRLRVTQLNKLILTA